MKTVPHSLPPVPQHPPVIDAGAWSLARRIHRSMLPDPLDDNRVDMAVHYEEHEILGGDYCTVLKRTENHLFLCMCDVNGHGLPAALLAGRINSFVRHEITVARHPCEVVETLNRFVTENFAGLGIDASFLCVEVNLRWRSISYAGAGHPPALLQRRGGKIEMLDSLSPRIGVVPETSRECHISKTHFDAGARLLLFTDGLHETRNAEGEILGIERVATILRNLDRTADSETVLNEVVTARRRFAGHDIPDDDVLVVAARFF